MANETIDKQALLRELNDDKAVLLIPAMLFVIVLLILGVIGNIMVWIFYGCQTKITPSTSFILTLSIFDLLSCAISMPMEIIDMRFFFNFESNAACKVLRCLNHFSSFASGLTLIAIATDRYRRICKPFNQQLNNKHVRIVSGFAAVVAILLSWPAMIFNTVMEVDVKNQYSVNLTGLDCTTSKEDSLKTYIFAYSILQFSLFIITTGVLAILYFFIGRQLFRHKKYSFYVADKSKRVSSNYTFNSDVYSHDNLSFSKTLDTLPSDKTVDESNESDFDLRPLPSAGMPDVEGVLKPVSDTRRVSGSMAAVTDISGKIRRVSFRSKSVTIYDLNDDEKVDLETVANGGMAVENESTNDKSHILMYSDQSQSENRISTECNDNGDINHLDMRNDISSFGVASKTSLNEVFEAKSNEETSFDVASKTSLNEVFEANSNEETLKVHANGMNVDPESSDIRPDRPESAISSYIRVQSVPDITMRKKANDNRSLSAQSTLNTDMEKVDDMKMKMLDINTIKYTLIMLVITIIFVVSFLPYLSISVWRSFSKEHESNFLTDAQLLWLQIGLRSYFLNSSLNPLIYGFFNSNFRAFFYGLFCGLCRKRKPAAQSRSESTSMNDASTQR